jgi:hypothetical protein
MRLLACAAIALALSFGVAACGGPAPARILSLADGGNGDGYDAAKVNQPYTFLGPEFCLNRSGTAVITKIEPYEPSGGMVVQDFAFVASPFELGARPYMETKGSIQQLGRFGSPGHIAGLTAPKAKILTVVCKGKPGGKTAGVTDDALYIQIARTSSVEAGDQGIVIDYTSAGHRYRTRYDWSQWLCPKPAKSCVDPTSDAA